MAKGPSDAMTNIFWVVYNRFYLSRCNGRDSGLNWIKKPNNAGHWEWSKTRKRVSIKIPAEFLAI